MKKTSLILAFIMLMSSTGISVARHYCNGDFMGMFLHPEIGEKCNPDVPLSKDSCQNEMTCCQTISQAELITPGIEVTKSLNLVGVLVVVLTERISSKLNYENFIPNANYSIHRPKIYLTDEALLI